MDQNPSRKRTCTDLQEPAAKRPRQGLGVEEEEEDTSSWDFYLRSQRLFVHAVSYQLNRVLARFWQDVYNTPFDDAEANAIVLRHLSSAVHAGDNSFSFLTYGEMNDLPPASWDPALLTRADQAARKIRQVLLNALDRTLVHGP